MLADPQQPALDHCAETDHEQAPRSASPLVIAGRTEDVLTVVGDVRPLLTAVERRRADALRSPLDRADFVAAHVLVRLCAAEASGVDPTGLTLVQRCPQCGGDHGPPVLAENPGLQVSLSHTRGYVAAIAGVGPVGIDVERSGGSRMDARAMSWVLSPREAAQVDASATPSQAFLRHWVRKEALVKAGATRLEDMAGVDLSALAVRPLDGLPWTACWNGWDVLDWSDEDGAVLGSAVSDGRARVLVMRAPSVAGLPAQRP